MKKNLGSTDKIIRVMLGVILSYLAYTSPESASWIRVTLYIVAAVLFLTTAFGICPLYSLFKRNTCEVES